MRQVWDWWERMTLPWIVVAVLIGSVLVGCSGAIWIV